MQTMTDRLATLKDGELLLINAPAIEHMIAGTERASVTKDGIITVRYANGTVETRKGSPALLCTMDADNPCMMALIGHVQEGRQK